MSQADPANPLPSLLGQYRRAAAKEDRWTREVDTVQKRLQNSVFNWSNGTTTLTRVAAKAVLAKTVKEPTILFGLVGAVADFGKEAWASLMEADARRANVEIASPAAVALDMATHVDDKLTNTLFTLMHYDPHLAVGGDYRAAWKEVEAGIKAGEKWWLPTSVNRVWRWARRSGPISPYYSLGQTIGNAVSRPLRFSTTWADVSRKLAAERATRFQDFLHSEATGAYNPDQATPDAALPTTTASTTPDPTRGAPTGSCACTDGRPAAAIVAAPAGMGGSVADVRATATLGLETLRRAAAMVSVAQQALAEASRRFAVACDGSREQAPKDVVASYGAADTSLASVAPALAGAESNVLDWIDGL